MQLQQSMSRQSYVCRNKHLSKWLRKICHDNIYSVATQRTEYRRAAMLRQKTACGNRTWEECNKSTMTKKDNVVIRFVSWMSTSGRTCCDIKAPIATLKTRREQSSVTTMYLMSRQEIKEKNRKNTTTDHFMLRHNEK